MQEAQQRQEQGPRAPEPVAADPASRHLLALARRVAASDATVMITGESGVGKEVFARFLHGVSARAAGPFIALNCAAIPENMLEAMLFGYERGAFTGATEARAGKFEQAEGGTLLLDEVTEMAIGLQAKLLRALQEREIERLGGRRPIRFNVRVIATSNRDLRAAVRAQQLREDLYYRLNVLPLHLPPLRERPGDVLPLARYLLGRHAGAAEAGFTPCAEARLLGHGWPGNVRELDNVIQRALVLRTGARIDADAILLEDAMHHGPDAADDVSAQRNGGGQGLGEEVRNHEEQLILDALRVEQGSRKDAAARLGISPRTLRYKLARMRDFGVAIP